MPCSIPPSQIAAFIAKMLGKAEAYVVNRVMEEVNKIIQQLLGDVCPPVEEIKKLLATRDNLVNAIVQLEKKIEPINKFATMLDPPIKAAKVTVLVLEQIPMLGTVGLPPGPAGGVIFSLSVGAQNRFSQLLNIACQIVDLLEKDQKAIKDLTDLATNGLGPIRDRLESIDIQLYGCVDKLPQDVKDEVIAGIENLPSNFGLTTSLDGGGDDSRVFKYKDYTVTIVEDTNSPGFAKKRYAQVQNSSGVVVMRGPSSFSSSTKILLEEIKFRINNQLP